MNTKTLPFFRPLVISSFFILLFHTACSPRATTKLSVEDEILARGYAKGFDLTLAAELAKSSKDAADFEKKLNSADNKVNNLDLNDDGKVDYITVSEYGSDNQRGFSLTVEIKPDEIQEIANIQFNKNGDSVDMDVNGNPLLYGNQNHYRSRFSITDGLLLYWIFSSRSRYHSPYSYGNYPSHYNRNRAPVSNSKYQSYAASKKTTSSFKKSTTAKTTSSLKSPNASKNAARAQVLRTPTKSQRSFQSSKSSSSRTSSSRSGGFGRSSTSSSRSGGFGGGK
ncbi:MAG: hypothetical protein L3J39_05940 [Verrucomicrobiales bacterium]|nr:hypothetical protein [Verrucomicrobiales bacterium]